MFKNPKNSRLALVFVTLVFLILDGPAPPIDGECEFMHQFVGCVRKKFVAVSSVIKNLLHHLIKSLKTACRFFARSCDNQPYM